MAKFKQQSVYTLLPVLVILFFSCKTTTEETDTNGQQTETYFQVTMTDVNNVFNGTTLFTDGSNKDNPRVVEVDIQGAIIWEYALPSNLKDYTQPGFDAELIANGNILLELPKYGIIEITRNGDIIWEHRDNKISHDADRLENGNTIYAFGDNDTVDDAIVKEVDPQGNLVWQWFPRDHYNRPPFSSIFVQGWTHNNAVTRLANGNTLVSLRNFDITAEINPQGVVVWEFDWSVFGEVVDPHEPELQSNDNLLIALQRDSPFIAVEIERSTGTTVWTYSHDNIRTTRDADRLPNGNTLLVAVDTSVSGHESLIFEVTREGEVVWELRLKNASVFNTPGYFYKAQRIGN